MGITMEITSMIKIEKRMHTTKVIKSEVSMHIMMEIKMVIKTVST